MSQIWCNSTKLMTALLGTGREGMISVWSSIWSVPLAGCRRDAPRYACMFPMASTHRYTYPKITPGSPRSSLGLSSGPVSLNTDNQYLVKLCAVTLHIKMNTYWWAGCRSHWWRDCVQGSFYFRLRSISKESGPTSIQFRKLIGHTMTFYKICFTAAVIGIGY